METPEAQIDRGEILNYGESINYHRGIITKAKSQAEELIRNQKPEAYKMEPLRIRKVFKPIDEGMLTENKIHEPFYSKYIIRNPLDSIAHLENIEKMFTNADIKEETDNPSPEPSWEEWWSIAE